jgi:hypothetical protein
MATLRDSETATSSSSYPVGKYEVKRATRFLSAAGVTYDVSEAHFWLAAVGTPADNCFVQILNDSSGTPGTQNGGDSGSLLVTGSKSEYTFTFSGTKPRIVDGNYYWAVVCDSTTNSSDHESIDVTNSAVTESIYSYNGSTWSLTSSFASLRFSLYSADASGLSIPVVQAHYRRRR